MSWSAPLSNTLRILVDECVDDGVADWVEEKSAFNAVCVRKIASLKNQDDDVVMAYAKDESRIVLAIDTDFNRSNYPICTHPGIIRIAEAIRKFILSGHRALADHAITYITQTGIRIERKATCPDSADGLMETREIPFL
jgi:predicted nuclease of predicted toxin-antitoxin system